jgi:DNA-binding MarR family transcriptional regulator
VYDAIAVTRKSFETAVVDFIQAIGLLVRRARAAADSHELSWSETGVMCRLATDGPATTAELARAEGMKPQSMGATIAVLEEMGMIERRPHPTDGRQMKIELSIKGAAMWKKASDAKRTWLVQAIGKLDKKEQATLFAAGEIIKRLGEK